MKAIVKTTPECGAQIVEGYPEPTVGPCDVLLEVAAVSVCGTDREIYDWTPSAQAFKLTLPVVLGHEASGTVIEVGADGPGSRSVTRGRSKRITGDGNHGAVSAAYESQEHSPTADCTISRRPRCR